MSDTESAETAPDADDTRGRSTSVHPDRKVSAFELFELYWVRGLSGPEIERRLDIANSTNRLQADGIPMRDHSDAQQLRRGGVGVTDLWEEYLSEFQFHLAREIRALVTEEAIEATETVAATPTDSAYEWP